MNKELELEAEKYTKSKQWAKNGPNEWVQNIFITGATSKYVEKQKLEFAIEQLKDIDKKCFGGSNTCKAKIKELEEQLKQLEYGTTNT